jgi:hypothetical protein
MSLLQNSNAISSGGYDINNSLRFRSSASAYLSKAYSSSGTIDTWSFWIKRGKLGSAQTIFGTSNGVNQSFGIEFTSSDTLIFYDYLNAYRLNLVTTQVFRDPSAWYHIVLAIDTTQATAANRAKIYVNGTQITSFSTATYPTISQSLNIGGVLNLGIGITGNIGGQFYDGYMTDINFIDGQALTPSSFGETDAVTGSWVAKKYTGTYGTNGFYLKFANDSNSLSSQYGALLNGSSQFVSLTPTTAFNFSNNNWTIESFIWPNGTTNQCFFNYGYEGSTNRCMVIYYSGGNLNLAYSTNGSNNTDTSFGAHNFQMNQWYHLAIVRNGTTITAYINGIPLPTTITIGTSSINYPATSGAFRIGRDSTSYLSAFLHGFRIVNGTAVYTSKFKPTTTKLTAITNTQLLTLQDATLIDNSTNNFTLTNNGSFSISAGIVPYATPSIAVDYSGNYNNWLIGTGWNANDISDKSYCVMYDSPTLTSDTIANYCVLNPLPYYGGYNVVSQGNLQFTSGNSNWMRALATFAVSSGKWYWEVTMNNIYSQMHGIVTATTTSYYAGATNWVGYDATGYGYFTDGNKWNNNAGVAYGATWTAGDVIGIAFDADNGKLYFSKNGTFQASGDPVAGTNAAFTGLTSGPYVPAVSLATTSGANTCDANFGQRPFAYTPPTGFKRLNTFNLPDSTIKKGNTMMDATLYTGNGTNAPNALSVTNAGSFKPDLVWIKIRSGADIHNIQDSVRGLSVRLSSNNANADSATGGGDVSSLNSNGFTISYNNNWTNANGSTYVAWQWQAGQGTNTTNTSGSITSTVSVNTTAGFSVVTFSGNGVASTVGHGLGVAPSMIITKGLSLATSWTVYHKSLTNSQNVALFLETTATPSTSSTYWNNTAPTSTVYSVGTQGSTNANLGGQVAYCWAEIAGFSKFGSYVGNGSNDGPFVYTGFRPKYIMVKRYSSSAGNAWCVWDSTRETYNVENAIITVNTSNAENTGTLYADFLSNGFKLRSYTNGSENASGESYIYACWAENPFKNANAR